VSELPAYESMVDSKITWLGGYPSHWNVTRVKFESYVKARVGWHGLKSEDFTEEGPYLVTGTDFAHNRINWIGCHHCDVERYDQDPFIQLRNGDLLITKDGTIGKLALVDDLPDKATLNSGIFVVRPLTGSYESSFYFWLLQSTVFTGFVDYKKTGSTIVHLYQETFENFSFALPPLEEQTKITQFLDYETGRIDALIDKQQQLIELLKEKRQAVISHAVTKGLNPDAPLRDSGVEWLGEVPEHWSIMPIKVLTSIPVIDGPHFTPVHAEKGVPFVSAESVRNGRIDFSRKWGFISEEDHKLFSNRYKPEKKDILLVKVGATAGAPAIVHTDAVFNIWVPLAAIRLKDKSRSMFLYYTLVSNQLRSAFELNWTFGTQQTLGLRTISNLRIPVPPLKECSEITKYLNDQIPHIDNLIDKTEQAALILKERRTALISAAVTGKIDVRDWEPPKEQEVA